MQKTIPKISKNYCTWTRSRKFSVQSDDDRMTEGHCGHEGRPLLVRQLLDPFQVAIRPAELFERHYILGQSSEIVKIKI